jgi:hypothetical protein
VPALAPHKQGKHPEIDMIRPHPEEEVRPDTSGQSGCGQSNGSRAFRGPPTVLIPMFVTLDDRRSGRPDPAMPTVTGRSPSLMGT